MHTIDFAVMKRLGERKWFEFLEDEYFPWKFTGNWLPRRLADLNSNGRSHLFGVKETLFALSETDLANTRKALSTVKSPKIRGLGYAGGSGLLAVLFPKWFGTADKFVVKGLCQIPELPERQELLLMIRTDSRGKESVLLNEKEVVLLVQIMRRKAIELSTIFNAKWTPRMVDMILWATRDREEARCSGRTTS